MKDARRAEQHDADGGPDDGGDLLAVPAGGALQPARPRALGRRRQLDAVDQARLYAMVNLAAADGAISCWNDKYYWHFWRPRAAIREAATDGNPATVGDPTLGVAVPPVHADDAAARRRRRSPTTRRGTAASAAPSCNTFREFFGTDKIGSTCTRAVSRGTQETAALRPVLGGAEGGRRRAGLGRDPLPHGRRPGRGDRQEGRALAPEALLQPRRADALAKHRNQGAARDDEGGAQHEPRADALRPVEQERRERRRRTATPSRRSGRPPTRCRGRRPRRARRTRARRRRPGSSHRATTRAGQTTRCLRASTNEDVTTRLEASITAPAVIDGTSVSSDSSRTRLSRNANSAAPTSAARDPDPADMTRPVRLERERDAAAHDQHGAEQHRRAGPLVEDEHGDGHGEQRRHAERDGRPRRSGLADPDRDEEVREPGRDRAGEQERRRRRRG